MRSKPQVKVPRQARAGDVVLVRAKLRHPMETGWRENAAGETVPRNRLHKFVCAFEGAEVLYHLAAVISIDGGRGGLVHAVNVEGAGNVAEAALDAGVRRMLHFSSIHAFAAEPLDEPLDEGELVDLSSGRQDVVGRLRAFLPEFGEPTAVLGGKGPSQAAIDHLSDMGYGGP